MKIERMFWMVIAGFLAIMLMLEKCKKPIPCPTETVSIEVTKDTTQVIGKSESSYKPEPVKIEPLPSGNIAKSKEKKPVENKLQWVEIFPISDYPVNYPDDYFPPNKESLLPLQLTPSDTLFNRKYKDTLKLGTNGFVVVDDDVRGEILKRSFTYSLHQVTTTIKETIAQKQRNKWYYGIEAIGNKATPVNYIGGVFGVQLKRSSTILLISSGVSNEQVQWGGKLLFKF